MDPAPPPFCSEMRWSCSTLHLRFRQHTASHLATLLGRVREELARCARGEEKRGEKLVIRVFHTPIFLLK